MRVFVTGAFLAIMAACCGANQVGGSDDSCRPTEQGPGGGGRIGSGGVRDGIKTVAYGSSPADGGDCGQGEPWTPTT